MQEHARAGGGVAPGGGLIARELPQLVASASKQAPPPSRKNTTFVGSALPEGELAAVGTLAVAARDDLLPRRGGRLHGLPRVIAAAAACRDRGR
jgi:hypothetical protein